jgi:hypothetical protein
MAGQVEWTASPASTSRSPTGSPSRARSAAVPPTSSPDRASPAHRSPAQCDTDQDSGGGGSRIGTSEIGSRALADVR